MTNENKYDGVEGELKVVPLTEIKAEFDGIKSDIMALRSQMESEREATGLAIEQRAGDLQKALAAVENITMRFEEVERKIGQNAFAASFGSTAAELREQLLAYKGGFYEFNGDNPASAKTEGTAPSIKHLVEGAFAPGADGFDGPANFIAPRHEAVLRMQKAADTVLAVDACMRAQMEPTELREYQERGGARSLKCYKRFASAAAEFTKAAGDLIDTTTEVANWVPTQWSAQLYERIKLTLPLLNLWQEIQMGAPTVYLPLDLNDKEAMLVAEVTSATNADPYADTNFVNPSAVSSNKITLTAKKMRARYWLSEESDEDTIVGMLPLLNRKMVRNIGEALEDADINGQPTNIDTGGTHYGKANPLVAAGTDARDAWNGLRYLAAQYASTPTNRIDNSNTKPTVVGMRGLRAAMGEYGIDPMLIVYLFGMFGYVKLLDDTNVLTLDKIGQNATIRTGVMGMVDGCDIMVSRRIPQNANATGIIDGVTTNRTLALAVNREAFIRGNRRRITISQQRHVASDSTELVAFWRGDFAPIYPAASIPSVGLLYNVIGA